MPANTHAHMHTGCLILFHPVWSLYVEHQTSMFLLCELPWKNLWPLYTNSPLCFCCVSWPGITRAHACKHTHMNTGCSILLHPVWPLYVEHQPSMFLLCELPWKNLWSLYTTSPLCFCCVSLPGITRAHACKHTCTHAYRLLDPPPPCLVVVCRAPALYVSAVWAALEKSVAVAHYQPSMFLLCELAYNYPFACAQTHMYSGCSILLHHVWSFYVKKQPSKLLLCELAWKNLSACVQTHTCIQAARSSSTLCGRCM